MEILHYFLLSVVVGVTTHYVIKWLDRQINSDN